MVEEVVVCIHGLEHDTCSVCCEMDVEVIKEEVKRNDDNFSWRDPIYSYMDREEVEIDNAYDIEIEVDNDFD